MPRRRIVLSAAAGLVLVVAFALAVGVRRQLPDARIPPLPQLSAPVEVDLDARGIPTIRARSLHDAFVVQGYLVARERMFQLELQRRLAGGELAELVGAAALPVDRLHRTYGFAQAADAAIGALPPSEREDLESFAAGVNAFLASHPGRWGLELELLGITPRPWRPSDSVRVLLLMHEQLSSTWERELQTEALAGLPRAKRDFVFPEVTGDDVLVVPDANPAPRPSTEALFTRGAERHAPAPVLPPPASEPLLVLGAPVGVRAAELGSNDWVIAGSRTVSGRPVLANDPHLGLAAPNLWFPVRIVLAEGPMPWMQGVALPGIPGIVIGQNARLAWGFTNTGTDVQDLYREPALGGRTEIIHVKGAPDAVEQVSLGKHGPMVKPSYALHWTALDPAALRLPTRAMMTARDWESFNAAVDLFLGPAQNVVYADVDGHIGYRVNGLLPMRRPGDDGQLPRDGTDPANDWRGYLPIAQMPRVRDPPDGFIATANQRVVGTSFGVPFPGDWASPTRARRISEMIRATSKLDAAAVRRMQLDVEAPLHRELVALLRPLMPPTLARLFDGWDGRAEANSGAFRAAEALRTSAYRAVLRAVLGTEAAERITWYSDDGTLLAALRASSEAWVHAGLGDREAVLREAIATVPVHGQRWGEVNRLRARHPFGRAGGILGFVFNPPSPPQGGCTRCVRVAAPAFGQSMRFVVDLAAPLDSTLVLPFGVSGHVGSEHRLDQQRDWLEGDVEGKRTRFLQPAVETLHFRPPG